MLITLDQAKAHLAILHDDLDEVIEEKVNEASAIVLDYLKRDEAEWQDTDGNPSSVPYVVQAAVKLVLGALMENRGDSDLNPLSQTVKDLLHRLRDPAMA